jgi:hypothetical protein
MSVILGNDGDVPQCCSAAFGLPAYTTYLR